jgi:hypothetical protein
MFWRIFFDVFPKKTFLQLPIYQYFKILNCEKHAVRGSSNPVWFTT